MGSEPLASPGVLLTGAKIVEGAGHPISASHMRAAASEITRLRKKVEELRHESNRYRVNCSGNAKRAKAAERARDELLSRAVAAIGDLRGSDVPPGDAQDAGEGFDLAIDRAQSAIRALAQDTGEKG